MTFQDLLLKYRRIGDDAAHLCTMVSAAAICTQIISDLEALRTTEASAELDLSAAAKASGYSADHLRRMVRQGRLPVVRRGRQLFFRAGDLPSKPRSFDEVGAIAYDPIADARRVAAQRIPGGIHGSHSAA
jgi:hypothetical protein